MGRLRFLLGVFPFLALLLCFFLSYTHLSPTTILVKNEMIASPREFSILIGILTRADLYNHRHFLRILYGIQSSSIAHVDVKFVFCNLTKEEQRVLVSLEMLRYDDIIVLNCTENMNHGKTYTYFSSVPKVLSRRYDYVMKADDDVYIRLEQLSASIGRLELKRDFYYGFVIPCKSREPFVEYMSGMAYLLSWDLVEWISESEIPATDTVGPEDKLVGKWLRTGGKGRNRFTEKPAMYDYPGTNGGCSHELLKETVAVHRLKRQEQWLDVIRFFNVTQGIESSFLH
ncbi:uncharacterized protein A4U43_C07F23380 [Asparagus officinalis]|uniref:Hexosyltransferase n=1 Tax=Asparagus officinalis TaxID=4686 RepID=A0A5P1EJI5_ASPOF|nr:uncharacterized protein LOC109849609 [Asparagus officinalis]ONK64220.1 uncharacterized protein A4U43_C07F23380 [Asparagus officinalis]